MKTIMYDATVVLHTDCTIGMKKMMGTIYTYIFFETFNLFSRIHSFNKNLEIWVISTCHALHMSLLLSAI